MIINTLKHNRTIPAKRFTVSTRYTNTGAIVRCVANHLIKYKRMHAIIYGSICSFNILS